MMKSLILSMGLATCLYAQAPATNDLENKLQERRAEITGLTRLKSYDGYFNNVVKIEDEIKENLKLGIPTHSGFGSGYNFHDSKDRSYYVTAYHCISGEGKLWIHNMLNERMEANIEGFYPAAQIAILSTVKDKIPAKELSYIDMGDLVIGEDVYIPAFPEGNYRVVKKSSVSGMINTTFGPFVILDEIICGGYSGAPAFVERVGKLGLVGVLNLFDNDSLSGLAIPADRFGEILGKYDVK